MRSILYAATVLVLLGAGLANVAHQAAWLHILPTASASLAAQTPIQAMIANTLCGEPAPAQNKTWITAWTASVQGPYPSGFALLQPDLSLVFPDPARGAADQSFRMIVRPDLWSDQARIRLSNAFGTKPIRFDQITIGLQFESSAVSAGTNRPVTFGGQEWVEIPPGKDAWSDAAPLPFVPVDDAASFLGRKLAVSFHVRGESGPMTWHAKALTTSYLTMPHTGTASAREDEAAFPFSTTSAFFLDAVDMMADAGTKLVVAFGDSLTDGMGASLNGQDRWPDVLSRRLHDRFGSKVAVVNAGIAGNRILKPDQYSAENPDASGPAAIQRLARDVLSLSGVSAVIWLQGINDLGPHGQARLEELEQAFTSQVRILRSTVPAIRVIGATLTSARGSAEFGARDEDRKALNAFIRTSGLFDAVIDFDGATANPRSGALKTEYTVPTNGVSKGDGLHPNRAGYLAMAGTIDLDALMTEIATEPSS
jgi:lysophospholipase L1-like esterase